MVKCSSRQDHVVGCQGLSGIAVDYKDRTWKLIPHSLAKAPAWVDAIKTIAYTLSLDMEDKYAIVDDTDVAREAILRGDLILLGEVCN
jgi:hypothetical protein